MLVKKFVCPGINVKCVKVSIHNVLTLSVSLFSMFGQVFLISHKHTVNDMLCFTNIMPSITFNSVCTSGSYCVIYGPHIKLLLLFVLVFYNLSMKQISTSALS